MIALSLRQPWAWVVLHLGKHLENRRWDTRYRGPFLIHASKGLTKAEYYDAFDFTQSVVGPKAIAAFPPLKALPRGCIVGAATLDDVVPPCQTFPCEHPWHMEGQYGFRLSKVRPSPAEVPCVGHLGFFRVPDDVAEALRRAAA